MGSFLNMLIYRLPEEISLINPSRSMCPKCKHMIKWYENIPLFSFFYLKAKCSNCHEKISIIYPIVELFTAIISVLLYLKLNLSSDFLIILFLFYVLILLSFIDFKYKAVPDYLLLLALVIALFSDGFSYINMFIFSGAFILLNFVITFYIQNIKAYFTGNEDLKTQTALGEGDIPIVAIIGGILGLKLGLMAIFFAAIFAIIPALYNKIKNDDIETAFIPFLVLGFFFIYLFDINSLIEGVMY
jgi:leader peptidase (prepilin peptidase)/N-methyltransferase